MRKGENCLLDTEDTSLDRRELLRLMGFCAALPLTMEAAAASSKLSLEPCFESCGVRISNQMHDGIADPGIALLAEFGNGVGPERPFFLRHGFNPK